MKVTLEDYKAAFTVSLEPETMEEAAQLVRLGMDSTKKILRCETEVYGDDHFHSHITIKKHGRANSTVPKRR